MQHVALEGRCFVLTACQFIRKKDFPETVRVSLGDSPDAVLMRGGSAIINPLGKVLAGPHFEGETILTAELDLNDIGRGKFDFDVAGHYSRPDVFKLIVNEAPALALREENDCMGDSFTGLRPAMRQESYEGIGNSRGLSRGGAWCGPARVALATTSDERHS
jgi:Carbon-nitrogen hydrolase